MAANDEPVDVHAGGCSRAGSGEVGTISRANLLAAHPLVIRVHMYPCLYHTQDALTDVPEPT